jgi:hypothetical protein
MRLFDTTVGTFLGPSFGSTTTKYLKTWSEKGTDSGIEEPHMLLAQHIYKVLETQRDYRLDTIVPGTTYRSRDGIEACV